MAILSGSTPGSGCHRYAKPNPKAPRSLNVLVLTPAQHAAEQELQNKTGAKARQAMIDAGLISPAKTVNA